MFDIDGVSQATIVTYYGYRKARAKPVFFSCDATTVAELRAALLEKLGRSQFDNHETFVLSPDILALPYSDSLRSGVAPVLAITFSDGKAHFGGGVVVGDWDNVWSKPKAVDLPNKWVENRLNHYIWVRMAGAWHGCILVSYRLPGRPVSHSPLPWRGKAAGNPVAWGASLATETDPAGALYLTKMGKPFSGEGAAAPAWYAYKDIEDISDAMPTEVQMEVSCQKSL